MELPKCDRLTFDEFLMDARELAQMLGDCQRDILLAITGNKVAAQRARLTLLEINKRRPSFRKNSMKYITKVKRNAVVHN